MVFREFTLLLTTKELNSDATVAVRDGKEKVQIEKDKVRFTVTSGLTCVALMEKNARKIALSRE